MHAEIELIGHLRPFRHAGYSLDTEFTVERNAVDTIMRCGEGQLKRLAEFCHCLLGTRFREWQGGYQITRCHRLSLGGALDQERPYGLEHRTALLRREHLFVRAHPVIGPRKQQFRLLVRGAERFGLEKIVGKKFRDIRLATLWISHEDIVGRGVVGKADQSEFLHLFR